MTSPSASAKGPVVFRPFEERDLTQISEFFRRQWCAELEEARGLLAAEATVCNYLMDTDWGVVAELDGRAVGTALVSCGETDGESRRRWRSRREGILAEVAPGARFGHEVGALEAEEDEVAQRFSEQGGTGSEAEIKLLIVGAEGQGLGLGRKLLDAAGRQVRRAGGRGFFLITDDCCDVGFYEHLGLARRHKEPSRAEPGVSIYVYTRSLG